MTTAKRLLTAAILLFVGIVCAQGQSPAGSTRSTDWSYSRRHRGSSPLHRAQHRRADATRGLWREWRQALRR